MDFDSLANSASGMLGTASDVASGAITSATNEINSLKSSASSIYGDAKANLIAKLPQQVQNRLAMMEGEVPDAVLRDFASAALTSASKEVPVDARTVLARLVGDNPDSALKTSKDIITLSNLQMVSGMPPMGDNVVDPPPFINGGDAADSKQFSTGRTYDNGFATGLCGMDYIERCIISGQFLTLVPLTLTPDMFGNTLKKVIGPSALDKMAGRLGIASYGLGAKVSSRRYWRTYTMLLKAAALSLGVAVDNGSSYTSAQLEGLLPTHMFEMLITGEKTSMFKLVDNETESSRLADANAEYEEHRVAKALESTAALLAASVETVVEKVKETVSTTPEDKALAAEPIDRYAKIKAIIGGDESDLASIRTPDTKLVELNTIITNAGYNNFLKYSVNTDSEVLNARLPIMTFYVNGVVDRSFSSSSTVSESVIARDTTDLIRKAISVDKGGGDGVMAQAQNAMSDIDGYLAELAYHGSLPGKVSFALSNTSIPSVISNTSTDYSFTLKITEQAIGSDPISLLRVQDLYCKLVPFITPVSDGSQNTVVPQSPLYCSAFVKGTMNVPRGAITSVSIVTNPAFQTSEGVPTVMDVTITIQPLLSISAIPDMGRFFSNDGGTAIIASMYNPMSAFNILATMCGYNTVLSKFPFSLFEYFLKGKISSFFTNLKESANFVHTSANDFVATRSLVYGSSIRVR